MKLPKTRPEIDRITPYVPGKPIDEVKRELGLTDVIKLASNENPLGPSPRAREAAERKARELHIYPDGNCFALKQALADHLGVSAKWLFVGNGSDEIIKLLAEAFLQPGEEVIYGYPSFSEYAYACRLLGGKETAIPLKDERYDLAAMAEAISEKTKLVFVCNPNNPTGTMVTRVQLDEFLKRVPDHVLVIIDEAYYEYVTARDTYPVSLNYVREGRNVIILRTFSKIYGLAGLRIGYSIARPEITAILNRVKEPFNVNSVAQAAALAALTDQEHVAKSRELNEKGIEFLCGEFDRMGLSYLPTQANFIFVDCGVDSKQLFQELLREGVIVRTGDIFDRPTWIRVTVGTSQQNRRFVNALEGVLAGINRPENE